MTFNEILKKTANVFTTQCIVMIQSKTLKVIRKALINKGSHRIVKKMFEIKLTRLFLILNFLT